MGKPKQHSLTRSRRWQHGFHPRRHPRWLAATVVTAMMALSTVTLSTVIFSTVATATVATATEAPQQAFSPRISQAQSGLRISQRIRRRNIWQEVQKQLPDLPRENDYISRVTGEPSESDTLVRRMIEYHNFRKGRSPRSRFDWKLTLADYLGSHDIILAEVYPSANKLKTNPRAGDIAAVQAMSRSQRDQLINTLVSLYNPQIPADFFTPADPSRPSPVRPSSATESDDAAPLTAEPAPLAEPGAADLLRPR